MIPLSHFKQLDLPNRAQRLWVYGEFLACLKGEQGGRSLYALENCLVEMIYDTERDRVLLIHPFTDTQLLDEWLHEVDIQAILP